MTPAAPQSVLCLHAATIAAMLTEASGPRKCSSPWFAPLAGPQDGQMRVADRRALDGKPGCKWSVTFATKA